MNSSLLPRAPVKALAGMSPVVMITALWSNRSLIWLLAKREVSMRVRGSTLGILWLFLVPLAMLGVYTFAFGIVFRTRWSDADTSPGQYSLLLFIGLLLFNIFAETTNRAPGLLLENTSYVKKVVFPLEILPVVALVVSLCNFAFGLALLCVFYGFVFGLPPLTIFLFPLVLVPLCLLTLGLTWLLASLGVFLRDVRQLVGVAVTMLMFLSPVFYPVTAVPERFRAILYLNPLTIVLEQSRELVFFGHRLDWKLWAISVIATAIIAWLGFAWFSATRRGFADVV
jgi:lipopolysaccharide transport system permease protein